MNKKISDDIFVELEEIYKAFASVPRLKMLLHLKDCNGGCCEHTVGELVSVSGLSQSATSHQLKDLKNKKIVKSRKNGLNVYYSLQDEHIYTLIESALEHVQGVHCE